MFATISFHHASSIFHCALGFTNNRLQAFCKHNLEHNIHSDNVLEILEASDKMSVPDIKNYALRMIVRDFSLVNPIFCCFFFMPKTHSLSAFLSAHQVVRLPKMKTLSRELLLEVIEAMADVLTEVAFSTEYASISIHSDL